MGAMKWLPKEPEVRKRYLLVKVAGGNVVLTTFARWADGSAGGLANYDKRGTQFHFVTRGAVYFGKDEDEQAWKPLWEELRSDGFVELDDARSAGILPPGWAPPDWAEEWISRV